jgi:hypothetical protein
MGRLAVPVRVQSVLQRSLNMWIADQPRHRGFIYKAWWPPWRPVYSVFIHLDGRGGSL